MKHFSSFLFCILALLSACGNTHKPATEEVARNLVSHTAPEILFSVSIGQLLDKSGVKDGSSLPPFSSLLFGENLAYLQDEKRAGIRFEDRVYILAWLDAKGTWYASTLLFGISNTGSFTDLLEKEVKTRKTTQKNGFNYTVSPAGDICLAWNDRFGMAVRIAEEGPKTAETLLWEQLALTEKIPEVTDTIYDAFFAATDDLCWFTQAVRPVPADSGKAMNYSLFRIHFETDRIVMRSQLTQRGPGKTPVLSDHSVPEEYLDFLSDKGLPWGFATVSAPLTSSFDYIRNYQPAIGDTIIEHFHEKTGLSLTEVLQQLSGDFAVSFAEMQFKPEKNSMTGFARSHQPGEFNPTFHLSAGLRDEEGIKHTLDSLPGLKAQGAYYRYDTKYYLVVKNKKLFISNHEDQVRLVAEKGSLAPYCGTEKTNMIRYPFYGYFDFKLLVGFLENLPNPPRTQLGLISTFDYLRITGNSEEALFEIQLRPGGKNALSTIISSVIDRFFSYRLI